MPPESGAPTPAPQLTPTPPPPLTEVAPVTPDAPSPPAPLTPPTVTPPVFSANSAGLSGQPKPRNIKRLLFMGAGVVVLLALIAGSYWVGTHKHAASTNHETVEARITIPKDATVTAECADMRGKQYIIPKNIPMGPIYDVNQGKVVAIEYLIGQNELTKQSDMFSNLGLPKVDYDHLTIMPMEPHAGENEIHFHAIVYLISQSEAAKIKCTTDQTMNMTGSQ